MCLYKLPAKKQIKPPCFYKNKVGKFHDKKFVAFHKKSVAFRNKFVFFHKKSVAFDKKFVVFKL